MTLPSGISVVVPVYNSASMVAKLVDRLEAVLENTLRTYEIVLVNDASRDDSWARIAAIAREDARVRGVTLTRNCGQHNALLAGIRAARFDTIVTLDDDLQNPPEEIPRLLETFEQGYDVVYGHRQAERHGPWRDLSSVITKWALATAMGAKTAQHVSPFRVFRTSLREVFADYRSPYVSIDVLLSWATTDFTGIVVRHESRPEGRSNYTVRKLVRHAFNMMTGFSTLPLKIASLLGFVFTLVGGLLLCYVLVRWMLSGSVVPGFAFIASSIAVFSGVQLFTLGILGEYIARIYVRSQGQPSYMIRETTSPPESPERRGVTSERSGSGIHSGPVKDLGRSPEVALAGAVGNAAAASPPVAEAIQPPSMAGGGIAATSRFWKRGDVALTLLLGALFFIGAWFLFRAEVQGRINSDLPSHMAFIQKIAQGNRTVVPHPGFHLMVLYLEKLGGSANATAVALLAAMLALGVVVSARVLRRETGGAFPLAVTLSAATVLAMLAAIHFPAVNSPWFVGVWSPNPWHNPTVIMVRPIGLIVFAWFPAWLIQRRGRGWALQGAALALLTALSSIVKPSFAFAFLPAVAVWIVLTSRHRLRDLVTAGLVFVPCLLLLFWQKGETYGAGSSSAIGFGFLKVWGMYVPRNWRMCAAIVQTVAFPLAILLSRFSQVRKSPLLLLAWVFYFVSLAQGVFLYEKGPRMAHCNFLWGLILGLYFLFLCSIAEFLRWLRDPEARSSLQRLLQIAAGGLLAWHFVSGVAYLVHYLGANNFY